MGRNEIIHYLQKFVKNNKHKYHIVRLGVFGSVARGENHDQSDLDIVVELEYPEIFDLIGIKQEIEESLGMPVDILRYRDSMDPFLKERIEHEALYV